MISLFLPGKSWLHFLSAGVKLLFLCMISILILPIKNLFTIFLCLFLILVLYASVGRRAVIQIKQLKPILPFLLIILMLHAWSGTLYEGGGVVLRILSMVLLANLVSMTTKMMDMMHALRPIFWPLKFLGVPYRKIVLSVALMIRFVPVLFAISEDLAQSYRVRSTNKPSWRLLAPFTILSLKMSENVGYALQARGGTTDYVNRCESEKNRNE